MYFYRANVTLLEYIWHIRIISICMFVIPFIYKKLLFTYGMSSATTLGGGNFH